MKAFGEDRMGRAVCLYHGDFVLLGDGLILQGWRCPIGSQQKIHLVRGKQLLGGLSAFGRSTAIIVVFELHLVGCIANFDAAIGIDLFDPELIAFQGEVTLGSSRAGERDWGTEDEGIGRATRAAAGRSTATSGKY